MTSSPEPRVSVVSPVRNGAPHLPGLLAGLAAQTLDEVETVVVDDASTDGTAALLRAWCAEDPERRRLVAGAGAGPAAARNRGVAASRAPWIAFTDADTLPDERWLEELLTAAGRSGADAVEGRVVAWNETGFAGADVHQLENETGGRYVTANMAYRRDVFERLGGFDEQFTDPFLEDSDLAFRLLDAGGRIVFAPGAVVRHRVIPSTPLRSLHATRKLRWLALLARKHPARYRAEIRPHLKPVTRPDAQVLAGLGGLALLPLGGAGLVGGALLVANGARVLVRSPRLRVPVRELPEAAAAGVAIPVAKLGWWLAGWLRWGWRR